MWKFFFEPSFLFVPQLHLHARTCNVYIYVHIDIYPLYTRLPDFRMVRDFPCFRLAAQRRKTKRIHFISLRFFGLMYFKKAKASTSTTYENRKPFRHSALISFNFNLKINFPPCGFSCFSSCTQEINTANGKTQRQQKQKQKWQPKLVRTMSCLSCDRFSLCIYIHCMCELLSPEDIALLPSPFPAPSLA